MKERAIGVKPQFIAPSVFIHVDTEKGKVFKVGVPLTPHQMNVFL